MQSRAFTRRHVLGSSLGLCGALALCRTGVAAEAGIRQLEGPLALMSDVGANVLALATSEGLVLVDSGAPDRADVMMGHVDALADKGLNLLFNTHWHAEQTGGNAALGERGIEIVAHAKTRAHLATTYYLPHENRYHQALPKSGIPATTLYTTDSRTVGGNHIEFGYLRQAHTDGDIYVFLRDQNVLAVGDVASPERDPAIDWYGGGWLGGRVDAMDHLLALADENTRIVPAFGQVMSRAGLQAERDLMAFLYEKTVELAREGKSARQMLDEGVMTNLPRTFDDPYRFLYDNYKGLWAHHNKLAPNVV